ncbi:hypothetical protein ALC57_03418 [Trachymyrmex cornetzi]|uniref:Uncharacterized protein n=1 Tax=Trachymyrmex cornetzi TaxID=471704 RepID=A0A195EFY6_9HYME|nr:hypothetical protein ALC57_03418 [Trachymyrmex cornetzi]
MPILIIAVRKTVCASILDTRVPLKRHQHPLLQSCKSTPSPRCRHTRVYRVRGDDRARACEGTKNLRTKSGTEWSITIAAFVAWPVEYGTVKRCN